MHPRSVALDAHPTSKVCPGQYCLKSALTQNSDRLQSDFTARRAFPIAPFCD